MSEFPQRPRPLNKLIEFVAGYDPVRGLDLDVAIQEDGRVVVFHSLRFTREVSWFEFDVQTRRLDFVMDGGEVRDIGLPLTSDVATHVERASSILLVLIDPVTQTPQEGFYLPLVVRRV